jgi:hypothetical protein
MIQHHFVVFSPESGLFVTTEWRVGGVSVVVVYPHPTGLYRSGNLVELMRITGPYTGPESVERIVGRLVRRSPPGIPAFCYAPSGLLAVYNSPRLPLLLFY